MKDIVVYTKDVQLGDLLCWTWTERIELVTYRDASLIKTFVLVDDFAYIPRGRVRMYDADCEVFAYDCVAIKN